MGLDRRIVSILYYNDINDINKIEKFIGENKDHLYEVIINGKVEKLKIPGYEYNESEKLFEETEIQINLESIKKPKEAKKEKNIEKLESFANNFTITERKEEKIEKPKLKQKSKPKTPKIEKPKTTDDDIDDFINTI
jgi:hypothetical protein